MSIRAKYQPEKRVTVQVQIQKSPIPIIWLDSSVLMKITLAKQGKSIQDSGKYLQLYETLYRLARDHKIICPEGDQREEMYRGSDAIHEIATSLSLGIRMRFRLSIDDTQLFRAMRANCEQGPMQVSYLDAFHNDPINELMATRLFFVTIHRPLTELEIEGWEAQRATAHSKFEEIRLDRRNKKVSFEQQLAMEFEEELKVNLFLWKRYLVRASRGEDSLDDLHAASHMKKALRSWSRASGNDSDIEGFRSFYAGEYYRAIPTRDIRARLFADLMVGESKIQSGDWMDVQHISTVLPFCTIVLTDKAMRNRVRRLGLDAKYQTKVFSMSDSEQLIHDLTTL